MNSDILDFKQLAVKNVLTAGFLRKEMSVYITQQLVKASFATAN